MLTSVAMVERVLKMVDGVVLVVDAYEGAMPQTKFVLSNALSLGLPVVVCVNKIDRPEARAEEVVDEILELSMELDATDEQLAFLHLYLHLLRWVTLPLLQKKPLMHLI